MSKLLQGPPPAWQPDSSSPFCVLCEVPFDIFRRRHHCRTCGRLVCYECSPVRLFIPTPSFIRIFGTSPQRICNPCDRAIREAKEENERENSVIAIHDDEVCLKREDSTTNISTNTQESTSSSTRAFTPDFASIAADIASAPTVVPRRMLTLHKQASIPVQPLIKEESEEDIMQEAETEESAQATLVEPTPSSADTAPVEATEITANATDAVLTTVDAPATPTATTPVSADESVAAAEAPFPDTGISSEDADVVTHLVVPPARSPEQRTIAELLAEAEAEEAAKAAEKAKAEATQPEAAVTNATVTVVAEEPVQEKTEMEATAMTDAISADVPTPIPPSPFAVARMKGASLRGTLTRITSGQGEASGTLNSTLSAKGRLATMRRNMTTRITAAALAADLAPETPSAVTPMSSTPTSSAPVHRSGRTVSADVFNSLWGQGSAVLVDTRPTAEYALGHVPRAVNLPLTEEDIAGKVTLTELEKRIPVPTDCRAFRMRNRRMVIICGHAGPEPEEQVAEQREAQQYRAPVHPVCEYLTELLLAEGKVVGVDVLAAGAQHFLRKYHFLACGAGQAFGKNHAHIPMFPGYPSEIVDGAVYLGSKADAGNRQQLLQLGVTHILNASTETPNFHEDTGCFEYLKLDLEDSEEQDMRAALEQGFAFLDNCLENGGKVLVHCQMGVSRSATIVIGHIMRAYKCTMLEAISMARSRRGQVLPNRGFLKVLSQLEESMVGSNTYEECFKELYPAG